MNKHIVWPDQSKIASYPLYNYKLTITLSSPSICFLILSVYPFKAFVWSSLFWSLNYEEETNNNNKIQQQQKQNNRQTKQVIKRSLNKTYSITSHVNFILHYWLSSKYSLAIETIIKYKASCFMSCIQY